jgi:hypothetical protein
MNCDDCRQRLQARLDGESVDGDDFDAHLLSCPACRALDGAARRLQVGLLAAAAPAPPAGLSARVVAGVLADRKWRSRRRLVFAAAGLAVAASLVLAVLIASSRSGSGDGLFASLTRPVRDFLDPPPSKAVVPIDPSGSMQVQDDPVPSQPVSPPSLNENVAEATSAVASLARRTADQTVSDGQMFVPSVPMEMPADEVLGPPLDPPAQSLREAGHGVATGLEPVTNSARRALDLFLRDIPPVAPETKSGL